MGDRVITQAVRGSLLDFTHVVDHNQPVAEALRFIEDGLLIMEQGRISYAGPWSDGAWQLNDDIQVTDYRGKLIVPGFIDTHIHYPQMEMVGAYGEQLLEWLNTYTFPTEQKYQDSAYARQMAGFFVKELFRHGTTTAMVFGTVHPESVTALFEEAGHYNMRLIAGKVMMDRNAPEGLLDTPESSYEETRTLINKWHNNNRLQYAITPRFAPTSSREQLAVCGQLRKEFPDLYMQTHLAENQNEVEWVRSLFPERSGYLDVYDYYQLLGARSVFAHGIYLTDEELGRLGETDSTIAFCPTSNLFLGSGLFRLSDALQQRVRVGLATDIGAGTSFSLLETLNEAYKVQQLQQRKLSALAGFYRATLGSAHALHLDDQIGNFNPGKEADFIVMDPEATPLGQLRWQNSETLEEKLFVLMMLGDDRNIYRTYVDGQEVHRR